MLRNPAALRQDPYGKGWLMTIHVPDEENTTRNLVPRVLVWRVDARSGRAALFPATRAGRGGSGRRRTPGGRPPGSPAGCRLEGSHRRVLPHRAGVRQAAVKICYTLMSISDKKDLRVLLCRRQFCTTAPSASDARPVKELARSAGACPTTTRSRPRRRSPRIS